MTSLDIDFVRSQFPAFSQPGLADQAFFENAGGSYMCAPVIARFTRYIHERKVQPYGPYAASADAGAEMDEARTRLSSMMNIGPDELSFGPSTTQNTYVLSQAFRQMLAPGDAIIVTNQDHEANSGPWRRLADAGIEVREWQIDPDSGALDPDALDGLLDGPVKLVVFPHCSNIVAEINPVSEICAKVHAAGAVTCVDGVSYAPHGVPDVDALGTDIYLFSAYKTYGPHQGIMAVRRALAERLPNQAHYFNGDSLPKKFTPAGPDHAQIAACAGIADYIDALADHHGITGAPHARAAAVHDLMRAHEVAITQPLLDWAASRNDLRLIGTRDAAKRAPTVAMAAAARGEDLAAKLADHKIMTGGGDFYGVRPITALGLDPDHGVLRLSMVHYSTAEEVSRAIAALEQIL